MLNCALKASMPKANLRAQGRPYTPCVAWDPQTRDGF